MNKNFHGPWEVVIDGTCSSAWPHIVPLGTSLDDINEECIAELSSVYLERSTDGMPGSWAEKPERFDKSPDHDEIMEKARLIASAPELLRSLSEVLEELLKYENQPHPCGSMGASYYLLRVMYARSVIAKATGESA